MKIRQVTSSSGIEPELHWHIYPSSGFSSGKDLSTRTVAEVMQSVRYFGRAGSVANGTYTATTTIGNLLSVSRARGSKI